ncbi:hypothetical protein [Sessilibacter corallicola]|uniref:Uncharacterized protein n=1 Tax=Sessilibacter corallicola TaxID=2904075 RepID=A0ABQ0A9P4_9GAMM
MTLKSDYPRPLWFSFSGGDKRYILKLISVILENNKVSEFQIDPKSYLQYGDYNDIDNLELSKVTYLLNLNDKITDLVDVIGMFPRRLLVLSDSYFKSVYCLMELTCSLIVSQGADLAFLLLGYTDSVDVFNDKISIELDMGATSEEPIAGEFYLAELLTLIYEKIIAPSFSPAFHLPANTDPKAQFDKYLFEAKKRLFLVGSYDDKEEQLLDKAIQLVKYSQAIDAAVFSQLNVQYEKFYNRAVDNWLKTSLGVWCKENYLNDDNKNKIFSGLDLVELRSFIRFIEQTYEEPKGKEFHANNHDVESIKSLCALLLLTTIDKYWATDMRLASRNGLRIKLAYSNGNIEDKILLCQIAAEAIDHSLPKLESVTEKGISVSNYFDITELPKAREEVKSSNWFNNVLYEIVNRLMPGYYRDSSDLARRMNENKDYVASDIRSELFVNEQYDDTGKITDFRVLIKPDFFASGDSLTEEEWESTVKQVMDVFNAGAEPSEQIKFGLVVLHTMEGGHNVQLISTNQHQMVIRKLVQKVLKVFL